MFGDIDIPYRDKLARGPVRPAGYFSKSAEVRREWQKNRKSEKIENARAARHATAKMLFWLYWVSPVSR